MTCASPRSFATETTGRFAFRPARRIKSLPASAHGASPFGDYAFDVESTPGSIRATTTVSVRKTRVSAQEYPAFRAWCEEVDRALGQQATVEFKGSVSSGAVEPRP